MTTTRAVVFKHILDILEYSQEVQAFLTRKGITNVRRFVPIKDEQFEEWIGEDDNITTGHLLEQQRFKQWLAKYVKKNDQPPTDWTTQFSGELCDSFILSIDNDDTSTRSSSARIKTEETRNNGVSNVKVDIKAYPTFTGKLNEWKPFKRQFMAIAQTHDLQYLLVNDWDGMIVDETSDKFIRENAFQQSALTFALAKSTAISKINQNDNAGDGRRSWLDLVDWYEDQGSEETIATTAISVINNHKLTPTSHGGVENFLEKFQQALLDLDLLGQPYSTKLAKVNLLNNIQDDEYKVVVETLRMDESKSYLDALQAVRRKSTLIELARKKNNGNRKINNTKKRNNRKKDKPAWFLPPEQWKKMSDKEKEAHK